MREPVPTRLPIRARAKEATRDRHPTGSRRPHLRPQVRRKGQSASGDNDDVSAGKAIGVLLFLRGIVVGLGSLAVSCVSCDTVETYHSPTTWYREHETV